MSAVDYLGYLKAQKIGITMGKYLQYLKSFKEEMTFEEYERIELVNKGDDLTLKKAVLDGSPYFEVFNMLGEKLGLIWDENNSGLVKITKHIKAAVDTVTPLSVRRSGSKYAAMTIRLDYINDDGLEKMTGTMIGAYNQTRIADWPPVIKIKSIFDAVIGITNNGDIYIDGFCPCSENEIFNYIHSAE